MGNNKAKNILKTWIAQQASHDEMRKRQPKQDASYGKNSTGTKQESQLHKTYNLLGRGILSRKSNNITIISWLVCGLGAIFYCYEYLLRIAPSVMVPELMQSFSVTATGLGSLIALYYYAYTPMQLLVGILLDRYGTRIIITFAVFVCAIGSILFCLHNIYIAGLGRFLIGVGSSFAFIGVLKLAAEWLPKHHFALFTGVATALGMVGAMAGDIGMSFLVNEIGWRSTLYIATAVGVILTPIIFLLVRDTPKWREAHAGSKTTFRHTFNGLLAIVKNPQMWLTGIVGCMFYLSLSLFGELWAIPFLQSVYHFSDTQAAFSCSMIFAGWLVGAPFSGWLSDKIKTRKIPLIVGGFLSIFTILLIILKPPFITVNFLNLLIFLFGIFSSVQIICFAVSRENNPTHVAATAVSFTNLLIMLGGMIFQPLVGKFLDLNWEGQLVDSVRVYSAIDFQHAFWILPISILIGVIFAMLLKETYSKKSPDDEFEAAR